jgi:hypothetical protein
MRRRIGQKVYALHQSIGGQNQFVVRRHAQQRGIVADAEFDIAAPRTQAAEEAVNQSRFRQHA